MMTRWSRNDVGSMPVWQILNHIVACEVNAGWWHRTVNPLV